MTNHIEPPAWARSRTVQVPGPILAAPWTNAQVAAYEIPGPNRTQAENSFFREQDDFGARRKANSRCQPEAGSGNSWALMAGDVEW